MKKQELIFKELSYEIVGICMEIHNELGRYKNEKQYCDRFEQKLKEQSKKYEREKYLPPSFKGEKPKRNRIDFIVNHEIIIDFKTKELITKEDYFQMQRYLTTFNKKLGLIINFRPKYLKQKRVINPEYDKRNKQK